MRPHASDRGEPGRPTQATSGLSRDASVYLFDIDGTLLPSSALHGRAFDYALRTVYGTDLTIAGINGEGQTDPWILAQPLRSAGWDDGRIQERFPDAFRAMGTYFLEHVDGAGPVVLPGVVELLGALRASGDVLGLLTGNLEAIAWMKLRAAGLDGYFMAGAFGEASMEREHLVPVALDRLGASIGQKIARSRTVIIGDTPLDIGAGRRHHLLTAGVATGLYGTDALRLAGADIVLPSFADWPTAARMFRTAAAGSTAAADGPSNRSGWDYKRWNKYWQDHTGEAWRTQPASDSAREEFLKRRLAIKPDVRAGQYPFSNIPLTRADIEWLLHNHGPVEVEEAAKSYPRKGIDLRGAILDGQDLHSLPLTRMKGGLTWYEYTEDAPDKPELWKAAAVKLRGADLHETHLERANLFCAEVEGANLRGVHFDAMTDLARLHLIDDETDKSFGTPLMVDIRWNGANLAVVDFDGVEMLGDEAKARGVDRPKAALAARPSKNRADRIVATDDAIRANRQLAAQLQQQGLNDTANRFTYRAQRLNKQLLWLQLVEATSLRRRIRKLGAWLFASLLDVLAGYGHKPQRALAWYAFSISLFALLYWDLNYSQLGWGGLRAGLLLSLNSFHGRAFFPGGVDVRQGWTALPAVEAVTGLFIEISLIAAFTRRFLGG